MFLAILIESLRGAVPMYVDAHPAIIHQRAGGMAERTATHR